jgi:YfiR/HmsC-like
VGTRADGAFLVVIFAAIALAIAPPASAEEEVAVPFPLQAELLSKAAGYDKNLPARAGDKAHVVVLRKDGSAESARAAAQIERAMTEKIKDIGGIPHDVTSVVYTTAAELAQMCGARRLAVVYVTPGLAEDIEAIAKGLSDVDVLTVSAVAPHVAKGIVLGFELVSGKLKLDVNLAQARRQHVAFSAELLQFARVVE